jgi:hypothetical protein
MIFSSEEQAAVVGSLNIYMGFMFFYLCDASLSISYSDKTSNTSYNICQYQGLIKEGNYKVF